MADYKHRAPKYKTPYWVDEVNAQFPTDYKNTRVPEYKPPLWRPVIGIVALVALLGWMGERDREHQQEMARLVTECSPVIEMDMPIQRSAL